MTVRTNDILRGEAPPGVYSIRSRFRPITIRRRVEARGWRFFYLDGRTVSTKAGFLDAIAESMAFPAYFGHNWDALDESITDLSWAPAPGYLLLYDHASLFAETQPDEWATAYDLLVDAAATWKMNGVLFYVVLREIEP